jgi:hypothetical protein
MTLPDASGNVSFFLEQLATIARRKRQITKRFFRDVVLLKMTMFGICYRFSVIVDGHENKIKNTSQAIAAPKIIADIKPGRSTCRIRRISYLLSK